MVLSGPLSDSSWKDAKPGDSGFHDLKGITETLLNKLHVQEYEFTPQEGPPYHPGIAALLMIDGKLIGTIGKIHPKVIEAYDLGKREVFAAEFDHELLLEASQTNYPFRPFSSHPAIFQDLALVVDDDVAAGSVMSTIREAAGELLTGISLFDIYRGEQLGEGKKSLAFQLTFCAGDRSLEEKEINDLRETMLGPLEEKLVAKIRA
jgi:phenylalanyl-tRNA synthetase beta chain